MKENAGYLWFDGSLTRAYFGLQAGLELLVSMGLLHGAAGRCDGFFSALNPKP